MSLELRLDNLLVRPFLARNVPIHNLIIKLMLTKAIYKSTFAKQAQRSYVGVEKLVKFNWEDPFLIENQLTEDEKMIRDSAR